MSQVYSLIKRTTLVLAACCALTAQAFAVTIDHYKGTVEFKETPKRVVVLGKRQPRCFWIVSVFNLLVLHMVYYRLTLANIKNLQAILVRSVSQILKQYTC